MQKFILLFIAIFLKFNASEYDCCYTKGDKILIYNNTKRTISVFNERYFITTEGIKYFHIGIIINPGVARWIDLSKVLGNKGYFDVYDYYCYRKYLIKDNYNFDFSCVLIKNITIGCQYTINEENKKWWII